MRITNLCQFYGNLTADAEMVSDKVAIINLAVNEGYGEKRTTTYIRIKLLGENKAKFAEQYLKKGTGVIVSASYRNANYEKDGKTVYRDELIANEVVITKAKTPGDNE